MGTRNCSDGRFPRPLLPLIVLSRAKPLHAEAADDQADHGKDDPVPHVKVRGGVAGNTPVVDAQIPELSEPFIN